MNKFTDNQFSMGCGLEIFCTLKQITNEKVCKIFFSFGVIGILLNGRDVSRNFSMGVFCMGTQFLGVFSKFFFLAY